MALLRRSVVRCLSSFILGTSALLFVQVKGSASPAQHGTLDKGHGSVEVAIANPADSLRRAQRQLKAAQQAQQPAKTAKAHTAVARAFLGLRLFNKALQQGQTAAKLYRQDKNTLGEAQAFHLIGQVQQAQGDTGQARNAFRESLKLLGKLNKPSFEAQVLEALGDLAASQNAWPQAQSNYEHALSAWNRAHDAHGAAKTMHEIGWVQLEQKRYSRALYYLNQSIQEAKLLHDSTTIGQGLIGTGRVYTAIGNHDAALGFYFQALAQLPRHEAEPLQVAELHKVLASTYEQLDNPNAAIEQLLQAEPLVQHVGTKSQLADVYQRLAALYHRVGKQTEAWKALSRYASVQDSAFAEQQNARVEELRTRYETEKKEREIQLLTKDRLIQDATLRRQRLTRNLLAVGTLLLLLAVAALYKGRTEQRRINRLLQRKNTAINRQKEELDRLNRTKDTLFSVISHDLRSPLSSLYSLLSLLNLGSVPAERLAAHSERLTRTLDTTLRLLDNLLNWAATQLQGANVRPEQLRLDAVAEECVALLLGDAERKNILLLNNLREAYHARADLNMTRLVLRNLLNNAIKFTPQGGTVTLSAQRNGPMWEVSVRDTGIGIAPDDQSKVLNDGEPYTTLGTAREKGIGLGLRLCKEFVARNGGRLSFESKLGSGSTFRFTVPAVDWVADEVATVKGSMEYRANVGVGSAND
jgi:signal transduction histidine kinase